MLESVRFIVAGLGNPGARYAGTRHDLGFALAARLADAANAPFRSGDGVEVAGPVQTKTGAVLIVRPVTYMNRSGAPLARLLHERDLEPDRLLVACDDVNLPLGRIRLRPSGSAGGHNGLKSIIGSIGDGFPRLRLGVGGAPEGVDQADWVLERFEEDERATVRDMLDRAADMIRDVVAGGVVTARTSDPVGESEAGSDRPGEETEDD